MLDRPEFPSGRGSHNTAAPVPAAEDRLRHDWSLAEIEGLLEAPLMALLDQARQVHRRYHENGTVQLASLLSIKTGACPEDCKYCPQSAHYAKGTGLQREALLDVADVLEKARRAREAGATRFCMGAAWRQVRDGEEFDSVLEMVRGVRAMGMEACVTLGMLTKDQAQRLAKAGLTAYNHNLDTSEAYYDKIITTRTFQDRLETIEHVRNAGVEVCCGGIIGMGESVADRASLLKSLASMDPHPESVPINALVPVDGTPLGARSPVEPVDLVRMIATARILMPQSRVRLSAGRHNLSREAQLLCLMAGANSIFYGEKLLTTDNNDTSEDLSLIKEAGLTVSEPRAEDARCGTQRRTGSQAQASPKACS